MSKLTLELHDLIHKNQVWPYELLDNLKDPDYLSVQFMPYLKGTVAEVIFFDQGKKVVANYYFNSLDQIQRIEMIEDAKTFVIYDRIEQIVKCLLKMDKISDLKFFVNMIAA